jgi:general secretion pathway protein L
MSAVDPDTPNYGRFINWWTGELAHLGDRATARTSWRLMVLAGSDEITVLERRGKAAVELARWNAGTPANALDLRGSLAGLSRKGAARGDSVVLRLDPSDVVRASINLPLAVRPIARKVLANRLELLAPWPADQVLFDHVETGADDSTFKADVVIANRPHVESLLDELKRLGIEPGLIDAGADADAPVVLNLKQTSHAATTHRQISIARALATAGIAILVATGAALTWEYQLTAKRADLDRSIQAAYKALRPDPVAGNAATSNQSAQAFDQRRTTPTVTLAVEALARRLPDDVVLDRIEFRDGRLTLTGKAATPHDLVSLIETLPHFTSVEFVAATTRAAGEARSSFALAARLQQVTGAPLP